MKKLLFFILIISNYLTVEAQKPYSIPSDSMQLGYTVAKGKLKLYQNSVGQSVFDNSANKSFQFLDSTVIRSIFLTKGKTLIEKDTIWYTTSLYKKISDILVTNDTNLILATIYSVSLKVNKSDSNTVYTSYYDGFKYSDTTALINSIKSCDSLNNLFLGSDAGNSNTSGYNNTFLGDSSGTTNTTGYNNVMVGNKSGVNSIAAKENTFIGNASGYKHTEGDNNTFVGNYSGYLDSSGYSNVFLGNYSGYGNTEGYDNIFIGDSAGKSNATAYDNIFIGKSAGKNTTSYQNLFIGNYAGEYNGTGTKNTYLGIRAGSSASNKNGNTFIGYNAGSSSSGVGDNNIIIGIEAGKYIQANSNTFIGNSAGRFNTIGANNIFIGDSAGYSNINLSNRIIINSITSKYGISTLAKDTTKPVIYALQSTDSSSQILTINGKLKVSTPSVAVERGIINEQNSADKLPAKFIFEKSRGTQSIPAIILNGDTLGKQLFKGYDGTQYYTGASITAIATGTTMATNKISSDLLFNTSPTSGGLPIERLRIDNAGNLLQGYSTSLGANYLIQQTVSARPIINSMSCYSSTSSHYPILEFFKSKDNNIGTNVFNVNNDKLGSIDFYGVNTATSLKTLSATISSEAQTSSSDSRLVFSTRYLSTPVNRLIITGNGTFSFGNGTTASATKSPSYTISINGSSAVTLGVEPNTSTAAGSNLTINAGNNTAGGTADLNGGVLTVAPGKSKNMGYSSVRLQRNSRAATTGTTLNTLSDAFIIASESNCTDNVADTLFEIAASASDGGGVSIEYTITFARSDSVSALSGNCKIDWARAATGSVVALEKNVYGSSADSPAGIADMSVTWGAAVTTVGKVVVHVTANCGIGIPTSGKVRYIIHNGGSSAITQR